MARRRIVQMHSSACEWEMIDMVNYVITPTPPPAQEFRVINDLSDEPRVINATTQEPRVT